MHLNARRRLAQLGQGRIVFEGAPAELQSNEIVRKEWLEV